MVHQKPFPSRKDNAGRKNGVALSFLHKDRITAAPGYNRWLIPPAALCVHLCIGQAYAFSVFNLPMTKLIGLGKSAPEDWKLTTIGWIFSIAIVFLGAVFPILVNTITGVRTLDANFIKVARSFGANDGQLFLTVALPSTVPLLLSAAAPVMPNP